MTLTTNSLNLLELQRRNENARSAAPSSPETRSEKQGMYLPKLSLYHLLYAGPTSASDSDSENLPESEEGENANPFPLEGKYEDDADRER